MTSLSYQEGGVFGACDTAESHNTIEQYKYISKQEELSKSYVCIVTNFPTIREPNVRVQETVGAYCTGMLNLDVKGIVFDCRKGDMRKNLMEFMPLGLESFFPHLEFIRITSCGLKSLELDDLKPFENLKRLQIDGNFIEKINSDLFKFNPKLTDLNLASNDISLIDPQIFNGLKLENLDLTGNVCVRKQQKSINETIQKIKENCSVDGHPATFCTAWMIFWTAVVTTAVYLIMIGAYVGVMRFKYQKRIKVEFFNELLDNCE